MLIVKPSNDELWLSWISTYCWQILLEIIQILFSGVIPVMNKYFILHCQKKNLQKKTFSLGNHKKPGLKDSLAFHCSMLTYHHKKNSWWKIHYHNRHLASFLHHELKSKGILLTTNASLNRAKYEQTFQSIFYSCGTFLVVLPLLLTMNIVSVHLILNFPVSIKHHEIIFK